MFLSLVMALRSARSRESPLSVVAWVTLDSLSLAASLVPKWVTLEFAWLPTRLVNWPSLPLPLESGLLASMN